MTDMAPGDVVEIDVGSQKAYVQITHNHSSYPPVVRVLEGLHDKRPSDLNALVFGKTRFITLIPLGSAMARVGADCEVLGSHEIPADHRDFPTFRMPIRDKQGQIVYWWFWDGLGLSYDDTLDAVQENLPLREVMTGARFLELLAQ